MSRDAIQADGLQPAERRRPRAAEGVLRDLSQLSMAFDRSVLATPTRDLMGMVRGNSPIESQRAAVDVRPKLTAIQTQIVGLLTVYGPMTARELETHGAFDGLGPSTVRKRISELKQMGQVVQVGRKDKMALWGQP